MSEIIDLNNKNLYTIDDKAEQINFLDRRFYKRNNKYYPSITTILNYYPKDIYFLDWLKQNGTNSDYIAQKAAREGTSAHKLIEKYLNGEKIEWLNSRGEAKYPLIVWEMLLKFVEFWTEFKPELIQTEISVYSDKYEIGGTCDLIIKLNGEIWVIDLKTSNMLHKSYDLQTAAYVICYEEMFGKRVDKAGILWLKSSKRKLNKEKVYGKGWELYESPRTIDENWSYFEKVHDLFKLENPKFEPQFNSYPTVVIP